MRKFTSFLLSVMVGCTSAFAQEEFTGKMVKIGTAQENMQPNTWYFLHTPRTTDRNAFATPGQPLQSTGSIPMDMGLGKQMMMTKTTDTEALRGDEGVAADDYLATIMRFVPVEGEDGVYNIQCATGNWMSANPNTGTVNHVQYQGGLAGKYNFYSIKINDAPNTAGRFGWNKVGMTNRMDSNGPNGTLTYYASGERKATEQETQNDPNGAAIVGNDVWQIYTVDIVGDVDYYQREIDLLLNKYTEINGREDGNFINNLTEGKNVGDDFGNYRPVDVQKFLKLHTTVEKVILLIDTNDLEELKKLYPNVEDLKKLREDYINALNDVLDNKKSMSVDNIQAGYYTINSANYWFGNKKDTVYYTQQEAEELNNAGNLKPGDAGYVTTDSIKEINNVKAEQAVKAIYSGIFNGEPHMAWGPEKAKVDYLWKIENVKGHANKYRLINMARQYTFNGVNTSQKVKLIQNDTVTVQFDYKGKIQVPSTETAFKDQNDSTAAYAIRNSHQGINGYNYLHCGDHGGGAGNNSWIVGWEGNADASKWYLTPVSNQEAEEWMNSDEVKLRNMVKLGDSIVATVPEQIKVAMDLVVSTVFEDEPVVTDASQFYSNKSILDGTNTDPQDALPALEDKEQTYKYLIDGDERTYWHSDWGAGKVGVHAHYLQIESTTPLEGEYVVKLTRRNISSGNQVTRLAVRGYNEKNNELTFDQGEDLGTVVLPYKQGGEVVTSTQTFDAMNFPVIRFYWEESAPANSQNGYWHAAEFNVYKAESAPLYETSQYVVRQKEIETLKAAMETWKNGEYSETDLELIQNPDFIAAYNALKTAAEAWAKVYVNPAELRKTINNAPDEKLFVVGNNPGQWAEGVITPNTVVNLAKAYDQKGAYSPAESQKHIDAINKAVAEVYDNANKVKTNKWYRLKFHTDAAYETYGWDLAGAEAVYDEQVGEEVSPALFGKVIASGISEQSFAPYTNKEDEADTATIYTVNVADEIFENNNLMFFDEMSATFEKGEDLFRFIQATDSSYMIQHKASGLFVKGGRPTVLSSVPTYFHCQAIGTGAVLLSYTDVLGQTLSNHKYLHGQRADNQLTCWEANSLGSNSMILIEEAEDMAQAPATSFVRKMWPGMMYAFVSPVDVTIKADCGAKAYGAQLVKTNDNIKVVLKKIESETISAGTPYIMVADLKGNYISEDDHLQNIADDICASTGKYGIEEEYMAYKQLSEDYSKVTMQHGMSVDTIQRGNGDLVGTFRDKDIKAGKAIVTDEDGFRNTISNVTVYANSAYIKSDIDPTSEEILSGIIVEVNGSIDTGVEETLQNVAKSGNIYTVDGKLVGKGNINTIDSMPAGIYVINGVKVVKK